ncbi:hypothetical protein AORI_7743 [Amycolatopsis keratiniphila]|uniref:Uncharacterized protein n=1 Tax=Amycolatopsis keratiniphila TaxID=129921 RepID=R4T676_9PSEU|nr:hypothetical protein AORI_7743 [Amycolatopsis keratiniphila]
MRRTAGTTRGRRYRGLLLRAGVHHRRAALRGRLGARRGLRSAARLARARRARGFVGLRAPRRHRGTRRGGFGRARSRCRALGGGGGTRTSRRGRLRPGGSRTGSRRFRRGLALPEPSRRGRLGGRVEDRALTGMTCDDVGNADPAVGVHRAASSPAAALTGVPVGVAVATGPRGVVLVGHSVSFQAWRRSSFVIVRTPQVRGDNHPGIFFTQGTEKRRTVHAIG